MDIVLRTYKPLPKRILRTLDKLNEFPKRRGVVPFSYVHGLICSTYHVQKNDSYGILYDFQKMGLLEIIPYHGVRVLKSGRFASLEVLEE